MKNIKLLYIEDDVGQRRALAQLIKPKIQKLIAVSSGVAGLELLKSEGVDVVLCDLNMPGMDGLEVLREVKKINTETPFILLSARGTVKHAVQAIKNGAYDFILKPVEINEIETTIKNAMAQWAFQHELRESETNIKMLLRNVPDLVYSLNPKGQFISLNHSVKRLLGYTAEEMLGNSVFAYIHEDDRENVKTSFKHSMQDGESKIKSLEFRMVSKSGEVKYFEVNRRLVFENDKVVRQDGSARDISERKRLQQELKQHSLVLEQKVKERTEKLKYASQQLAALNDVSNRFTQFFDEDVLLDEAPHLLTHSLDFDRATLLLEKNDDLVLRSFCLEKDAPDLVENFLKRVGSKEYTYPEPFFESFKENKTVFIPDLSKDPRWPKKEDQPIKTKAIVISPIKANKKPIGIIVGNMQHHDRGMDIQDVERFEMFSNMVGLALDNIRAYKTLERKVIERTNSLKEANRELRRKTKELESQTYSIGKANVKLLAIQEELEEKNTAMKNLLKTVSESNKRMQAILDSSFSAIIMIDKNNKILAGNKRVEDFFGIKLENILNRSVREFTQKLTSCINGKDRFLKLARKLIKQPDTNFDDYHDWDKIYERAFQILCPETRYVSLFASPIYDQENDKIASVWTFSDITRMKRADEQVRKIVEVSPIPFLVSRKQDGKILYTNEQMADLFGVKRRNLIGRYALDLYKDPDDRKQILEKVSEQGFVHNYELEIKKADGSTAWNLLSIVTTEIGAEEVLVGSLYDINERKQAEEALRESEEKFRQLTENIKEVFWIVDINLNKMLYVSPSYEEIFGRPPHKLYNDPEDWLRSVHPDDLKRLSGEMEESRNQENEQEFRIIRPDKSVRWIRSRAFPIYNDAGQLYRYCGVSEDITERKQAEEHLKETQGQLVQSEKMASLGMLVAGIAHEINTPIGAVHSMHDTLKRAVVKLKERLETNYAEACQSDSKLSTPIKIIQDANKVIDSGSDRVINIVRRLRSFARLDEAELKTVDIHEGIEDTLTLIHHELKHNVQLHKNFGSLPPIACFPGRLNQVYLNLLINARQAIKDQGEISITTSHENGNVIIKIADNGIGIPKNQINKIFDPGFTTKGVGVGTGLGLSICYKIIEEHRGRILVNSEVGKGTTFTIYIPDNLDKVLDRT